MSGPITSATEDLVTLSMATPALAHWPQPLLPGPTLLHDNQVLHTCDRPSLAEEFWRVSEQLPPQPSLFSQALSSSSWLPGLLSQPAVSHAGVYYPYATAMPGMMTAQRPARSIQQPASLQRHAFAPAVRIVTEPSGPPFLLPQLTQLLESSDADSWPAEQRPLSEPLASPPYDPIAIPLLGPFPASPSLEHQESPASDSEPGSPAMSMQQSVPLASARARQPTHGNAIVFPWPYQSMPSPQPARRAASTPALHSMDPVDPSQLVPLPMSSQLQGAPRHQPSSRDPVGHRVRSSAVSKAYPTHEEPPRTPLPAVAAPRPQRVTRARTGQVPAHG